MTRFSDTILAKFMLTPLMLILQVSIKPKHIFEMLRTISDVAKSFLQNTN